MSRLKVLGLVLARGGSQGVPNKNILPLAGQPVVCHTFDAALSAERLDLLAVSSDSGRVLELGREAGVHIIRRPAELATAGADIRDAIEHALDHARDHLGMEFDAVLVLYANVPLRRPGLLDQCIALMEESGCDCVKTFIPVGKFHPEWMSRIDSAGRVSAYAHSTAEHRQELPPLYIHDGAVLLLRTRHIRDRSGDMYGADVRAVVCDPMEVVDIDHPVDFYLAEALLGLTPENGGR